MAATLHIGASSRTALARAPRMSRRHARRTMVSMFSAHSPATVLVVHVNAAIGAALAQRLAGLAVVVLAGVEAALTELAGASACDVLVLCPYLDAGEKLALHRAAAALVHGPAIFELVDEPGGEELRRVALGEPRHLALVETVQDALTPEVVA